MTAAEFAKFVKRPKLRSDGKWWDAQCPSHDDRRGSLSFADGNVRVVVKCHAGCSEARITSALSLTVADLFFGRNGHNGQKSDRHIIATYDYTDARGTLLYQVVRFEPKDFRCRRPDGAGGWTWNLNGVRPVPYRLPDLAEQARVFVCEGEKDCDRLAALGFAATCNHGGAGKWRQEHTDALVVAAVPEVIVIPDNDEPGAAHAEAVARSCAAVGLRVKLLRLDGLPAKGDVSDWVDAGHTVAELGALAEAAPAWSPDAAPDARPRPTPIPTALAPVPAFDLTLLPEAFCPWVQDIAERTQCPTDFLAFAAMVAAGAIVGRTMTIRPKRHDDWTVVPNLRGVAIGRPGIMKTPALQEALKPLHRLVAAARERYTAQMADHEFALAEAQARRELAKKDLKKALEHGSDTDALRDAFKAPLPRPRRNAATW